MIRIFLIRHGKTRGNEEKRYIGLTDEPLSEEGAKDLSKRSYPGVQSIYVSPMLRCVQSARILYPGRSLHILEELRECDFGDFENKNYEELSQLAAYQAFIDSGGRKPFPNGESFEACQRRSLIGFDKAVTQCVRQEKESAAIITHGGTIMHIMHAFDPPGSDFYGRHLECGDFYELSIDPRLWSRGRKQEAFTCPMSA